MCCKFQYCNFFVRIVFRSTCFLVPAAQEFEGQGGLFIEEADPDEAGEVDKMEDILLAFTGVLSLPQGPRRKAWNKHIR